MWNSDQKKKVLPKPRKTTLMSPIWKKAEKKFVPSLYLGCEIR
ncbi:hypothetical protein LEP1GSC036_4443 [Leptospira weilii str. 2006001853]|uniref:Uncharacterized protein n=2 Tax=Leptospira weilii TaxID=28184 RepID=A0A828Z3W3_9LEPT|nr:hypothetical protein LEP1GSC036_4443 [Leptospira weilii str. 2006001853]EMN87846.1 hypothetical protein LEP1GSC108_1129 [Leptospira weilii str. UI 13098]